MRYSKKRSISILFLLIWALLYLVGLSFGDSLVHQEEVEGLFQQIKVEDLDSHISLEEASPQREPLKLYLCKESAVNSKVRVDLEDGDILNFRFEENQGRDFINPFGIVLFYQKESNRYQWDKYKMQWLGVGIEYFQQLEGL